MRVPATATVALALMLSSTSAPTASEQQPATAKPAELDGRGAATKAFLDRIQEYVSFHNNVEKMVPPLGETKSPDQIAKREAALGAALIKQRPDAKEGDFFVKDYQPHLIAIIKQDFAKRSAADRKALVVELPKNVKIGVNMLYPTTLPLATFPANLLKVLPELPKEIEYRIVGRHLILRDTTGNVIIDIMRDVIPIPGRT
jgi:hypothetical protein